MGGVNLLITARVIEGLFEVNCHIFFNVGIEDTEVFIFIRRVLHIQVSMQFGVDGLLH
jgi:hypothetical protein